MPNIKAAQSVVRNLITEDLEQNSNFQDIFPGGLYSIKEASRYALEYGKRLRPTIVHSLCQNSSFVLFIEYVHNSSLIVDDLPCMDNDNVRRGAPTLHCKYGEHIAQLVAYNLMIVAMKHFSDGYQQIKSHYNQAEQDWLYEHLHREISGNLGHSGIGGGQLMDLLAGPSQQSPREQKEMIMKLIKLKTGCLFSLSLTLGWVGRGGSLMAVDQIKDAGYSIGICYQIIDDLRDAEKDMEKNGGHNNICKYYTRNEIIELFQSNMKNFTGTLSRHQCWNPTLKELYRYFMASFRKEITKT